MLIAHPRGGLIVGLVIEALMIGAGLFFQFGFARGTERIVGIAFLTALLWGALIALSYASMVRIRADDDGVRGSVGFRRVDLRWQTSSPSRMSRAARS